MPTETPDTGAVAVEEGAAPAAPAPRRLGPVLAVIATAQLMVVLDLTIVTVALPHIQAALRFSGSNMARARQGGRRPHPPRRLRLVGQ